jgi:hypothetical protein
MATDTVLATSTIVSDSFMRPLMLDLTSTATLMFERAILMPKESYVRRMLLVNVLDSRYVQRQVWLAANNTVACPCKLESAAAAANSMAVCMMYLDRESLARVWYDIALREAAPAGHVHLCVQSNLMALDYAENKLSRSSTPTQQAQASLQPQMDAEVTDHPAEALWAHDTLLKAQSAMNALRIVLNNIM